MCTKTFDGKYLVVFPRTAKLKPTNNTKCCALHMGDYGTHKSQHKTTDLRPSWILRSCCRRMTTWSRWTRRSRRSCPSRTRSPSPRSSRARGSRSCCRRGCRAGSRGCRPWLRRPRSRPFPRCPTRRRGDGPHSPGTRAPCHNRNPSCTCSHLQIQRNKS